MTKKELLKELENFDDDAVVYSYSNSDKELNEVNAVAENTGDDEPHSVVLYV